LPAEENVCGNGLFDSGEECDDGNTNSSDGCSDICEVEYGYSCQGQPSACTFIGGGCGGSPSNTQTDDDDSDGDNGNTDDESDDDGDAAT